MKRIIRRQLWVHHAASITGGFLGGYTVFNHMDIFGNAQTGNLIQLVGGLAHGNLEIVWFALCSFLIYCGGNVFYVLLRRKTACNMKIVSLLCTAAAVAVVGAIPFVRNHYVACYPIIFAAPVQWNAFLKAGGNASSTIFSSNNVRQATVRTTDYLLTRNKRTGRRAGFFWMTLLCFYTGVALSAVTGMWLGVYSVWFGYLPVALTAVLYYRYKQEKLRLATLVHRQK